MTLLFRALLLLLTACSTMSVVPTKEEITVTREHPASSCRDLGMIQGRSNSIRGSTTEAVEDMKQEAIRKGANFVRMETIGAIGTSVRGTAFYCP